MMRRILFCMVLGGLMNVSVSGQKNAYLFKNTGPIPREFLNKGNRSINNLRYDDRSEDARKYAESFNDVNDYETNTLLNSGLVISNSPANTYLNKIADELLSKDPDTRRKLRIYILKSADVNAMTLNNGMIFICTGMLAHVENEAQLAFVLSHEIIHYKKQHIFKAYKKIITVVKEEEDKAKKEHSFDEDEFETNLITKYTRFSREQESEADVEGLKLLSKTSYNMVYLADYRQKNKQIGIRIYLPEDSYQLFSRFH